MENKSNNLGNEPKDIMIIQFGNKQKIVRKDQHVQVDHMPEVKKDQILEIEGFHISQQGNNKIKIKVKVIEPTILGEKIKIVKKKRRARYRRTIGFRAKLTLLEVL